VGHCNSVSASESARMVVSRTCASMCPRFRFNSLARDRARAICQTFLKDGWSSTGAAQQTILPLPPRKSTPPPQ
jgi:hypothetical protein